MGNKQARPFVALDSSVLYELQGRGRTPDGPALVRHLLSELKEKGTDVTIPAVVLCECAHLALDDLRRLEVLDFDGRAAQLASELKAKTIRRRDLAREERRILDRDLLILATATTHGALTLYSADEGMCNRALAFGASLRGLRVIDIPRQLPQTQIELFTPPTA